MIRAVVFDLDGTLVQTEKLKALSYAVAVQRLRGLPEPDARAVEVYRSNVGSTQDKAARLVADQLGLDPELRPLMAQYGAREPSDVLISIRAAIYEEMVADPQVLRDNQWPHTVGLLRLARESHCKTALATMSEREEAMRVLRALDLERSLDVVLTREDVRNPKPDPEIYFLAAERLGVAPGDCLALEDSPTGVRAAIAAGTNVVAVATPFTLAGLHTSQVLDHAWVVHDPDTLLDVVRRRIEEHNRGEEV